MTALAELFAATKDTGGVTVTLKRYDFQGVKEERQKKRARRSEGEEALQLLAGRMSLGDKEYATLVRAATEKRKISTLVAPAELDEFLARLHGMVLNNAHSIKKSERLRRKKAAAKKQAKAKQQQRQASAGASAKAT
ncbi:hypothetical protein LPJ61_004843 [Coemansia biformis]|uniref:Signal recognition particle subunit SRP14 n=1 Tax=Coemansia biformis TaxID=1286918 RepID=A0A9W8CX69_9FUNG|nr:hypothetical protein LPJ61_004843 [Coemansia biformis]